MIDDNERFRRMLLRFFSKAFPKVDVREYDPAAGPPARTFQWNDYDLLILDHDLGRAETGLDWLRAAKDRHNFPATIVLTGHGNEEIAVSALRHGAHDYLRKAGLTTARLSDSIHRALLRRDDDLKKADLMAARSAIFNKAQFYRSLEEARGTGELLLIGIDNFQRIHDEHGMLVADTLSTFILESVSELFRNSVLSLNLTRIGDATVAALITGNLAANTGTQCATRICNRLANVGFSAGGVAVRFTVSIGVVPLSDQPAGAHSILARAEEACRVARETSGNSFFTLHANDAPRARTSEPGDMRPDLSLENNRVQPSFQPLVRVSGTAGVPKDDMYQIRAVLVGMNGRLFSPAEYLPALRARKALRKLDRWIIRFAIGKLLSLHHNREPQLRLCVALSDDSIADSSLDEWLEQLFRCAGTPDIATMLVFEIRIEHFLGNLPKAVSLVRRLHKAHGVAFSLIGVTSPAQLEQATTGGIFEFVKFAPELYSTEVIGTGDGERIFRIIHDARESGAMTIAEKIETGEQLSLAIENGVDFVSGFFVQPPQDDIFLESGLAMR